MTSKGRKGEKVTRKSSQGASRRATRVRPKAKAQKSVYTEMNGSLHVRFPLTTTTDKKVLSAAVISVVSKMKD
jgi:hypothetical protein